MLSGNNKCNNFTFHQKQTGEQLHKDGDNILYGDNAEDGIEHKRRQRRGKLQNDRHNDIDFEQYFGH